MRIIKLAAPAVRFVKEHFIPHDYTVDQWAEIVQGWLTNNPEQTLFLAAVDGEDFLAYILLTAEEGSTDYAFIHQAWASPTAPPEVSDKLFFRACLWAEDRGKVALRMETDRHPGPFIRKWKFEEVSRIMAHTINSTYQAFAESGRHADLVGGTKDEVTNGQEQQQSEDVQHGYQAATTSPEGPGQLLDGQDGGSGGSGTEPPGGET